MNDGTSRLGEVLSEFTPKVEWTIAGIPITNTVVNTWIIMGILFAVVFILTRDLKERPRGKQTLLEVYYQFICGIADECIGKDGRRYVPLLGAIFVFILFLNFAWFIPGMMPPTADLATTAALAVTTVIIVQGIGIRRHGLKGYLRRFKEPFAFMLPMNIIEELIKPVSLALRLFGNLFGGEMVIAILTILVPVFVPVPIMVLEVIMGAVQAFIFTLLTASYIRGVISAH